MMNYFNHNEKNINEKENKKNLLKINNFNI